MIGYIAAARTTHPQSAFSNSLFTDAQSMPSMLLKAIDQREQDPGEHADVHQREPLDLQRRRILDAGRGDEIGAELLERLAEVLLAVARSPRAAPPVGRTG